MNFKPEFSGNPEEGAEAHLLCSNDWRNAHHFVNGVKVKRFCLTLLGEARLWFQSLEPLNNVTAKRILTKEKLDKQLTGQTSTSPFMNIRDGTERKVSFSARDELGDKIDKLTLIMSRLAAKNNNEKDHSNPKYIVEVPTPRVRIGPTCKEVIRIELEGQTVEIGDSMEIMGLGKTL